MANTTVKPPQPPKQVKGTSNSALVLKKKKQDTAKLLGSI